MSPGRNQRWMIAGVAVVIGAHLLLHGWAFRDALLFNADLERDLGRTLDFVEGRGLDLAGPDLRQSGLGLGPMSYLIGAPAVAVSPDPLVTHAWVVLLSAVGLGLLAVALRGVVAPGTVILCLAWLVASGFWFAAHRIPWHASLLPGVLGLHLLAARRLTAGVNGRWAAVLVATSIIAVQLHVAALVLALGTCVLLVVRRRALGVAGLARLGLVALVVATPLLLSVAQALAYGLSDDYAVPVAVGTGSSLLELLLRLSCSFPQLSFGLSNRVLGLFHSDLVLFDSLFLTPEILFFRHSFARSVLGLIHSGLQSFFTRL